MSIESWLNTDPIKTWINGNMGRRVASGKPSAWGKSGVVGRKSTSFLTERTGFICDFRQRLFVCLGIQLLARCQIFHLKLYRRYLMSCTRDARLRTTLVKYFLWNREIKTISCLDDFWNKVTSDYLSSVMSYTEWHMPIKLMCGQKWSKPTRRPAAIRF